MKEPLPDDVFPIGDNVLWCAWLEVDKEQYPDAPDKPGLLAWHYHTEGEHQVLVCLQADFWLPKGTKGDRWKLISEDPLTIEGSFHCSKRLGGCGLHGWIVKGGWLETTWERHRSHMERIAMAMVMPDEAPGIKVRGTGERGEIYVDVTSLTWVGPLVWTYRIDLPLAAGPHDPRDEEEEEEEQPTATVVNDD
ncbi:MAG TPA: hypothetical protein VJ742_12840 [Nitrososphaera sp.]|nr:hypothetical protein [Nitrososphaera sp.]